MRNSSENDFGLYAINRFNITYIKSMTGTRISISVVENFASATIANIHIRKPYIVLPVEPDIIFCGGKANTRNTSSAPAATIDSVDEKIDSYLTAITKISAKIVKELASIIPGEPAVHFTALIHTNIQKKRIKSPGNASESCNPSNEKSHVARLKSMPMNDEFPRFITEIAIINAAII